MIKVLIDTTGTALSRPGGAGSAGKKKQKACPFATLTASRLRGIANGLALSF